MSAKWPKKDFYTLRQVRPTMRVPRFGETNLTTASLTFGHQGVFCSNQLHLDLLLERTIWRDCTRKYSKVYILKYQRILASTQQIPLKSCCVFKPNLDQAVNRFQICQLFAEWVRSCLVMIFTREITNHNLNCYQQSEFLKICFT